MIYLDNAATTFPKPPRVVEAVTRCLAECGGNPGRGTHGAALAAAGQIYSCREALSAFLGLGAPERVLFTLNTTHALNLAMKGLLRQGDHVLISELEHNAVLRPLQRLREDRGVSFDVFPVLGHSETALLRALRRLIRPQTRAVICTHASNICAATLPIGAIGALCHRYGLLLIVDAAQSAGHLPIDMQAMQIDALAIPGHKGLYGIQGCGALLLGPSLTLDTLLEGGSGVDSLSPHMPKEPPERYEAGTLPTPAIAGLLEGVRALVEESDGAIVAHEQMLYRAALERLLELPDIQLYGHEKTGTVLLFNKIGTPSTTLAQRLAARGICTRAGLHCAPMAHRALQTPPDGAVRISFGRYNTVAELDALRQALKEE